MFENLDIALPDPILGLSEAFRADPHPEKINLSVGVFKDAEGKTPILLAVKEAERRLIETETDKAYLGIDGSPRFARLVERLLFSADHDVLATGRIAAAQTPGGTAALRVAADFVRTKFDDPTIWLSDPTWANHPSIFHAAGLQCRAYAYFDAAANCVDFDAMLADIRKIPAGDVVLLHGCCHNPSGADLSVDEWAELSDVIAERKLLPLIDFAYQGFGDGLDEDAAGLRTLCRPGACALVCSSFSKNFGLYSERVGALSVVAREADQAATVLGHLKTCIRANYSNPPAHGAAIVATILEDATLRAGWLVELAAMRDRIHAMRRLLVQSLAAHGVTRDVSFITAQRGMFSFSGLTRSQVDRLREEFSIYIVGSGRINVAGITPGNIDRLCRSIAAVL